MDAEADPTMGEAELEQLSSDAWVLLAIIDAARESPAALSDVIHAADWINVSILTFEEMEGALARLVAAGLVIESGEAFTPSARTLSFCREARPLHYRDLPKVETFLRSSPWSPSLSRDASKGPLYPPLTPERFDRAVQAYLASMGGKPTG